ncbi:hypothetical protein IE077_004331 [Cardiosporidium cionae]|uniref:Uncharacterized protein n=1 Tax=Cardiosporidium cionae TaxID=476202 RepID=A0ABQ7J4R5_9APIC|nr:hypothetical protein IE077_004331 [Cardiosporidium cionae]|eukprot:KAF8818528.1 hypothetical protein IE077_004331 [Cardiosporidium cionae]
MQNVSNALRIAAGSSHSNSEEDIPLKRLGERRGCFAALNSLSQEPHNTANSSEGEQPKPMQLSKMGMPHVIKEEKIPSTVQKNAHFNVKGPTAVLQQRAANDAIGKKRRIISSSSSSNASNSSSESSDSESSSGGSGKSNNSGKSSSTSSSSSDSSDTSNSEDAEKTKKILPNRTDQNSLRAVRANHLANKKPKPTPKKGNEMKIPHRKKAIRRVSVETQRAEMSEDGGEVKMRMSTFNPSLRSRKEKLVSQLLVRWWYAFPQWLSFDKEYSKELSQKELKCVSLEEWEDLEDLDENGFTKVYEISGFPGVFRDPQGNSIDVRDKDTCPSYSNFMKKSELQLLTLIQEALVNQLDKLKESRYDETKYRGKLQHELRDITTELREERKRQQN